VEVAFKLNFNWNNVPLLGSILVRLPDPEIEPSESDVFPDQKRRDARQQGKWPDSIYTPLGLLCK